MSAFSHQTLSEQKIKWRPEFPFQQGVSCHGEIEAFPRLQEQSGSDWFPQAWSSRIRAALPPVTGSWLPAWADGAVPPWPQQLSSCEKFGVLPAFPLPVYLQWGQKEECGNGVAPQHRCWASLPLPREQDSFTANE